MRIDLIRCSCGYEVRAMMRGGAATPSPALTGRRGASAAWKPTVRAVL